MSVFPHPVHLPDPSFTEICTGCVEFEEDIEHAELKSGERKSFKVKDGCVKGKVNAGFVPVVSTFWKSVDAAGQVAYESKFVVKPGKLSTISCDVYGNNPKWFHFIANTGWPQYTWLAHTIIFIRVDSVEGNRVTWTACKVD